MSDKVVLKEYQRNFLVKRLEYCKNVLRLEVAEKMKNAIALGDLSESVEFYYAKNFQAWLEGEINELAREIHNSESA